MAEQKVLLNDFMEHYAPTVKYRTTMYESSDRETEVTQEYSYNEFLYTLNQLGIPKFYNEDIFARLAQDEVFDVLEYTLKSQHGLEVCVEVIYA